MNEVTGKVREQLRPLYDHLHSVWGMGQKLTMLQKHCGQLDHLLTQIAQERSLVLKSLSSVSGFVAFYHNITFPLLSFLPSLSLSLSLSLILPPAHRVML